MLVTLVEAVQLMAVLGGQVRLGALVSLYKTAQDRNRSGGVMVRLLYPQPSVQQVFELTRMHHLFDIVQHKDGPVDAIPASNYPTRTNTPA